MNERFDVVTFRALTALDASLAASLDRLRAPGGTVVAYKGRLAAVLADMASLCPRFPHAAVRELSVPLLGAERHLLMF